MDLDEMNDKTEEYKQANVDNENLDTMKSIGLA